VVEDQGEKNYEVFLKSPSWPLSSLALLSVSWRPGPCVQVDNPYKQKNKFFVEGEDGEDSATHAFDAPDKLCLVQVRWASASVQTYRIGTYGQK